MKKICILLLMFTYTFSLQAQTPELCNETKNTITVTNTTTNTIDSVALPSTEIGNFTTTTTDINFDPPFDQKLVILLHGLAGSGTSWTKASTYSNEYFWLKPETPTYPQEYTMLDGFTNLHGKYTNLNTLFIQNENASYDRENTIVIGHSLGGIMTRFMDKKYVAGDEQRQFGGFATFGSPHAGAPIIANIEMIELYLDKTCQTMGKPFVIEFLNDVESQVQSQIPGWANVLFGKGIRSFLNNLKTNANTFYINSCPDISGLIFKQLRESIAPNIGEELHPDSIFMAELNDFVTTTPGLAFYGIEDAPVSWREIYSLNNNVNDSIWGQANGDDAYIQQASEISDHLFMQYEYYNLHTEGVPLDFDVNLPIPSYCMGDYSCISSWCTGNGGNYSGGICTVSCDLACHASRCTNGGGEFDYQTQECIFEVSDPELAEAYYDAWIWWNDFDRSYRIMFGHLELEIGVTGSEEVCRCYFDQEDVDNNDPYRVMPGDCSSIPPHHFDNLICISGFQPVYGEVEKDYPGDGVMPVYSASSFPGAQASVLMDGSNHQQLRNDKNTAIEFDKMYGGDYGDVFFQFEK